MLAAPDEPQTTIRSHLAAIGNPFDTPGRVLQQYRPDAQPTPAECLNRTDSIGYPLVFLCTYNGEPRTLVFPFTSSLPCFPPTKHVLWGDLTDDGQVPDILILDNAAFRLTNNQGVLTAATTMNSWANNGGTDLLPPVPAGDPNREEIRCRRTVPIPHEFASRILEANTLGTLTWRWLWTHIVDADILGNANNEAEYQYFIEYLQVASTATAPAAGAQANGHPATNYQYPFAPVEPRIRTLAMQKLRSIITGLQAGGNVHAQLMQIQNTQTAQQAAMLAAQNAANAPATIQSKNPVLYQSLLRICEVTTEAQLPAFHTSIVELKSGQWFHVAEQHLATTCAGLNFIPPLLSPTLVNDIGRGMFTGAGLNDMTAGFSLFRLKIPYGGNAVETRLRNTAYNILASGGGVVQADAVTMVLATNEVEPPTDSTGFRIYIQGQYAMLATFIGEHSRATVEYNTYLTRELTAICNNIDLMYGNALVRNEIYIKIMVFITRETDRYFTSLLHPPTGGADAIRLPRYSEVLQFIQLGRARDLTSIPPDMFTPVEEQVQLPQARSTSENRDGGHGGRGGGGRGRGGGDAVNQMVLRPNQNQNLKAAWTASPHATIFGVGSPYHDPSAPNRKKVIPSDDPDGKRICLPMALTGKCFSTCSGKHGILSDAEVQRVAQVGGLTVN